MPDEWLNDIVRQIATSELKPEDSRVLVVEDDPTLQPWLVARLTEASIPAQGVGTVADALDEIGTFDPAVVLVDKNLPDGSGLDLVRIGLAAAPGTEFVIMTGDPSLESAIDAVNLGAFGYLPKPFASVDDVLRRVRAALERRRVVMLNELLGDRLRSTHDELQRTRREVEMVGDVLDETRRATRQELKSMVDQLLTPLAVLEEDVATFAAFARDVADGQPQVRSSARAELGRLRMLEQIVRRLYLQTEKTAGRLDGDGD